MLVIVVGVGIRDATGCTNDCAATVIRPPEVAAIAWNWASSQSRAAPMPRTGSVWLDSVCRVPKETSFWIVASIRLGSISRNSWRSCLSGCCGRAGRPGGAAVGSVDLAGTAPMARDWIFRIASLTRPIVAAAVLMLVDDGRIGLDEPVARWLPELAAPRVVRTPAAPVDDVVPAARPVTVADLLTLRAGYGFPADFS